MDSPFELFGLGLANLVVHLIILIGTFGVEQRPQQNEQSTADAPSAG
jgi:hypothetical protein